MTTKLVDSPPDTLDEVSTPSVDEPTNTLRVLPAETAGTMTASASSDAPVARAHARLS